MVYPALLPLLPLMGTPRLPVVDWTDSPAVLNGLVHFPEKPNLISARVSSRFKRALAHGDAREGKWKGNWRMEWVASTLHTTSEHGVSSITTADAHTSAAGSRLNWRPRRFKWTRPFRRKTKSGFSACAITFQLASTTVIKQCRTTCMILALMATLIQFQICDEADRDYEVEKYSKRSLEGMFCFVCSQFSRR